MSFTFQKTLPALALALSFASSAALAHGSTETHQHTVGDIAVIDAKLAPGEKVGHVILSDPMNWAVYRAEDHQKGALLMKAYKPNTCTRVMVMGDQGSSLRSWLCNTP